MGRPSLVFLGLVCILTVVNRGVFLEYAYNDDFQQLCNFRFESWARAEHAHLTSEGRPLFVPLLTLLFRHTEGIPDLAWIRLVAVVGGAVLAWLLWHSLRRAGWEFTAAAGVALTVCSTSAMGVLMAWATLYHFSWTLALAFGAGELALRAGGAPSPGVRRSLAILAVALQIVALAIYQPCAMAFLLPLAIRADALRTGRDDGLGWREASWHGLAFLVALLAYLVWYTVGLWPFQGAFTERFAVEPLHQDFTWRWPRYWLDAASLCLIRQPVVDQYPVALPVSLLILGGFLRPIWRATAPRLVATAVCLMLLPLGILPTLASPRSGYVLRAEVVLMALVALYLHSSLQVLLAPRQAWVAMAGVTLLTLGVASQNVSEGFARPKQLELEKLRSLVRAEPEPIRGSWLYIQAPPDVLNPWMRQEYASGAIAADRIAPARGALCVLLHEVDGLWRPVEPAYQSIHDGLHLSARNYAHVLDEGGVVEEVQLRLLWEPGSFPLRRLF